MKVTDKICKNCIYHVSSKCLMSGKNTGMFSICKKPENFSGNIEYWNKLNYMKWSDNMITLKQIENLVSRYECDINISGDGLLVTFNKDTEKEMCHFISYEMEEAVDYFALAEFLEKKRNTVRFEDLITGELFEINNMIFIKTVEILCTGFLYNAVELSGNCIGVPRHFLPHTKVIKKGFYKDEN